MEYVKAFIGDSSIDIRRATGECLGMLARIEGDSFTTQLVKSLIQQVINKKLNTFILLLYYRLEK